MELLLVRHALPERREVADGPADPELSEAGHRQAAHLADYLAAESIHAIYTSPMRRAIQTAAPLAQRLGQEPVVLDGVAEYDRHSSAYVPVEELKATNDPRWQQMLDDVWDDTVESREEFTERVVTGVESVIAANPGRRAVVVCHGGVINSYLAHVLGTPQSTGFFYPNYTSIHRVVASRNGQRQILTINETAHLRGTGLPIGLYGT